MKHLHSTLPKLFECIQVDVTSLAPGVQQRCYNYVSVFLKVTFDTSPADHIPCNHFNH